MRSTRCIWMWRPRASGALTRQSMGSGSTSAESTSTKILSEQKKQMSEIELTREQNHPSQTSHFKMHPER